MLHIFSTIKNIQNTQFKEKHTNSETTPTASNAIEVVFLFSFFKQNGNLVFRNAVFNGSCQSL